jgi:hypothetical protein
MPASRSGNVIIGGELNARHNRHGGRLLCWQKKSLRRNRAVGTRPADALVHSGDTFTQVADAVSNIAEAFGLRTDFALDQQRPAIADLV